MPRTAALVSLVSPAVPRYMTMAAGSSRLGLIPAQQRIWVSHQRLPLPPKAVRSLHSSPWSSRAPVPSHPAPPLRSATSPATATLGLNGVGGIQGGTAAAALGGGAGTSGKKKSSGHLIWYREIVPAMLPILLLSTTIFLLLSLSRTHLSAERSLAESQSQITALEAQLAALQTEARRRVEKERKERERMLPLVVEKVLTKVGAMRAEEVEPEDAQAEASRRLLV